MQVADYLASLTGKSIDELFDFSKPLIVLEQHTGKPVEITYWDESIGVDQPSADDLANALEAGPTIGMQKSIKSSAVDAKIVQILTAGAPSGGLHVSLDDSSRADMGSMATTALAAISGAVPWPDSYKQGWISVENTRIPLATADEGLTLAAGVGDYYAKVRQNGRTLKDAIASANTQAKLDAVDVDGGWPAN